MNEDHAIERYRQPLLAIVVALYAMIGLVEGGVVARLRRPLYRKVLAMLRPAESAVRRLIVVAAQGLKLEPRAKRPALAGRAASSKSKSKGKSKSRRPFRLFDPRERFGGGPRRRFSGPPRVEPRIRLLDFDPRIRRFRRLAPIVPTPAPKPEPDGTVNAVSLCRRLAAIRDALQDLQRQARRYARWRDKPFEERRPKLQSTLRPGPAPYLHYKSSAEVHDILAECHWLARDALKLDTS